MQRCTHGSETLLKASSGPLITRLRHVAVRHRAFSSQPGTTYDVAILGGGVTGLAAAYYLTKELPKARITIYEGSDRLGGWLSSKRIPVEGGSVLFESGPRSLRTSSNGILAARLLQELDIAKDAIFPQQTSPAARNRFIYYPDRIVRLPHPSFGIADNLWSLFTEPVFKGALWAGIMERFREKRDPGLQDESVGDFFSRRLDRTMVDRILSGVLHGIYAGDAWKLSVKSLFPGLWRDELNEGSLLSAALKSRAQGIEVTRAEAEYLQEMSAYRFEPLLKATLKGTSVFTFREGLGTISDALARHLIGTGNVEFRTSTVVDSITTSEDKNQVHVGTKHSQKPTQHTHVISTLLPATLNVLAKTASKRLVPSIPSVTVMTVNLYYRTPDLTPPGFGYLIPQATSFEQNPERALGVIFDHAYSPSSENVNISNWSIQDADQLEELNNSRHKGNLVNVNDFAWYNMPDKPNVQDDVEERGTKVTVMLGGHWWDGWPAYPDEQEGLSMAKAVLERHLGIREEPEASQVRLQRDCISQYVVGHEMKLKEAHNNIWHEYRGRLKVAGSWISGVGVNDCLRSAWDVVRGLKNGKDGTGLEHIGTTEYTRVKWSSLPFREDTN